MRRAAWSIAAVIGVVGVALLAALIAGGPDPEPVTTVGASGRSQSAAPTVPTSTTAVPVATTSTVATPTTRAVTPTTVATTATTAVPAPASTPVPTAPRATTTTVADGGPPGPACAPSMFSATVTMAKPTFVLTEPVQATSTFRNVSGQTCYWASDMGGFDILDSSGASVVVPAIRIADAFRWVAFPAGDATTETWTWDQRICRGSSPCVAAPAGRYTFVVNLQPYGSGRASFAISA